MNNKQITLLSASLVVLLLGLGAVLVNNISHKETNNVKAVELTDRRCTWGQIKACYNGEFNECCPKEKPKMKSM